jgi:peptidoglycan hydrolase-like protein with peptidoglycan-binding domain
METLAFLLVQNQDEKTIQLNYQSAVIAGAIAFSLATATNAQAAITQGASGLLVTGLQERLKTLGYLAESPSGYFGDKTREAVVKFQRDRKLTVDGVVGDQTEKALRSQPLNKDTVRQLQQELKSKGVYQGAIDGELAHIVEVLNNKSCSLTTPVSNSNYNP